VGLLRKSEELDTSLHPRGFDRWESQGPAGTFGLVGRNVKPRL